MDCHFNASKYSRIRNNIEVSWITPSKLDCNVQSDFERLGLIRNGRSSLLEVFLGKGVLKNMQQKKVAASEMVSYIITQTEMHFSSH